MLLFFHMLRVQCTWGALLFFIYFIFYSQVHHIFHVVRKWYIFSMGLTLTVILE